MAAAVLATTGGAAMPATIDVAARDAAADFAVAIAATAAAAASIVASEGEDASAVLTKKHAGALAEALADAQTRLFYANEALRAAGDALDALHAAEAQDATTFTLAKQEATRPALMVLLTTKEAVCVRIQKVIAAAAAASGRAEAESVESEESEEGGAEWSGQAGGGAVATAAAGSLSIVVEWTAPLRMSVERIDREVYRKLVDAAAPASIEAQIALDARLDTLRRCTLAEAVRKVGGMESWVHDEVVWHRCVYMRDPCVFANIKLTFTSLSLFLLSSFHCRAATLLCGVSPVRSPVANLRRIAAVFRHAALAVETLDARERARRGKAPKGAAGWYHGCDVDCYFFSYLFSYSCTYSLVL